MNNSFMIWFSIIFFFLFLEMGHPGLLYFLSFSIGALCACIASFLDASIVIECSIFIAGTLITLFVVHFLAVSLKNDLPITSHRSNIQALIGKKIIVFRSLENSEIWQAKIFGQIWIVKSIGEQMLSEGQQVIIIDVQGCHLRVDSIK